MNFLQIKTTLVILEESSELVKICCCFPSQLFVYLVFENGRHSIYLERMVKRRFVEKFKIQWKVEERILDMVVNDGWLFILTLNGVFYMLPLAKYVTSAKWMGSSEDSEIMMESESCMKVSFASYLKNTVLDKEEFDDFGGSGLDHYSILQLADGFVPNSCMVYWSCGYALHEKYILIGSNNGLVSFVNLNSRTEVCRCELRNAGNVNRIELVDEKYRLENRTSMLVETDIGYFQVLLERCMLDATERRRIFPCHFEQDAEFKPKKIKRFAKDAYMFAKHQNVGVYDGESLRIFSSLKWRLLREHGVMENVQKMFAITANVMLVVLEKRYGELPKNVHESQQCIAWIALASKPRGRAKLSQVLQVFYLTKDEYLVNVCTSNSCTHFIFTNKRVYECRSFWSKLILFKQLSRNQIAIARAWTIGHALHLKMDSLLEIVADGLVEEYTLQLEANEQIQDWIFRLYEMSTASPLKVSRQMMKLNAYALIMAYIDEKLVQATYVKRKGQQIGQHEARKRTKLAHLLFQNYIHLENCNDSEYRTTILQFIASNVDYDGTEMLQVFGKRRDVLLVLHIGIARNIQRQACMKLAEYGIENICEPELEQILSQPEYASLLWNDHQCRSLLRSFPIDMQAMLLGKNPDLLLCHRDWLVRQIHFFSIDTCEMLANAVYELYNSQGNMCAPNVDVEEMVLLDCSTSEFIPTQDFEVVELLLLLYLVVNQNESTSLKELIYACKGKYRADIFGARCILAKNYLAFEWNLDANASTVDNLVHQIENSDHYNNSQTFIKTLAEKILCMDMLDEETSCTIIVYAAKIALRWYSTGFALVEFEFLVQESKVSSTAIPIMSELFFNDSRLKQVSSAVYQHDWEAVYDCRKLPFTGNFLICLLQHQINIMKVSSSHYNPNSILSLRKLISMVLTNMVQKKQRTPPTDIRITDTNKPGTLNPLETHIIAFSCGHVYPRLSFYEEVIPSFEKQVQTLGIPNTISAILKEYSKDIINAACPDCVVTHLETCSM